MLILQSKIESGLESRVNSRCNQGALDLDVVDAFLANAKALMQKRGITQVQLANHFEVSPATVNSWFQGKNVINMRQALELAAFLRADFNALCYDYNELKKLDIGAPGVEEQLKDPRYRLARELGYPIFTQEVE